MSEARAKAVARALRHELEAIANEHPRLSARMLADGNNEAANAMMLRLGQKAVEAYERFEWQASG